MTEGTAKTTTWGLGRRKEAVARVRMLPGTGLVKVNGREANDYFRGDRDRSAIRGPLLLYPSAAKYDILANVKGGGSTGQAGAIVLGIARAITKIEPELEPKLRAQGFLTRDSRMVERKKYGQRKARRRFQYSKR